MNKKLLRQKLKIIRCGIENRAEKDSLIFEKLKTVIKRQNFKNIFTYVSMENEVDTHRIISYYFSRASEKILVPFCQGGLMQALELADVKDLSVDKHGNLVNKKAYGKSSVPDVVIVPLLGFNSKKFRIGYGGGYYDKFLSANNIFSIGLAYDEQYTDDLINESFDVPVDMIITPGIN